MPSTTHEDDNESPSDWAIWSDEIDRSLERVRRDSVALADGRGGHDDRGFALVEQALLAGSCVLRALDPALAEHAAVARQKLNSPARGSRW
jgi:hypothetical protein